VGGRRRLPVVSALASRPEVLLSLCVIAHRRPMVPDRAGSTLERDTEWIRLTELKTADELPQVGPVSNNGGRGNEGGIRAVSYELGVNREDARRVERVALRPHEGLGSCLSTHGHDHVACASLLLSSERGKTSLQELSRSCRRCVSKPR
jgi:hypothetical protein